MVRRLSRSIDQPIREGIGWEERWLGPDRGLIGCWERGRKKRLQEPNLAARAGRGELVELAWKGGVQEEPDKEKPKSQKKFGCLPYLATWQGLRGQDLDIALEDERLIVCSKTRQAVVFRAKLSVEEK